MKAAYLVKNGNADQAFDVRDLLVTDPQPNEVQILVEGFGLNFADVMARLGLYPDAPKKPGILGYDVVGTIVKIGAEAKLDLNPGDRVLAMTRFGGYSQAVNTDFRGVAPIGLDVPIDIATSLATQGGTAYYMAREMVNIFPGDKVLIHAAAGGVGSLLCQMAKDSGAIVFGTASSAGKLEYISSLGVDFPINYKISDFAAQVKDKLENDEGLDVIFDAVGGSSVRKGFKLLGSGGRMVLFGASALTSAKYPWNKLGVVRGFGLYSPITLLNPSKSLIGVNMLRIADDKPEVLQRVLQNTVSLFNQGIIQPQSGGVFPIEELAQAHEALGNRKTMGKLAIKW